MHARNKATTVNNPTTGERTSERELVFARTIHGPARLVFEAWAKPELFQRWWAPKSMGMTIPSCEIDVRVGGGYRLLMRHAAFEQPMAFFGRYLEVTPNARIVWTNDESPDGPVSTVALEETAGATRVVLRDLYPSKEALDAAIASGSACGITAETFNQLEELVAALRSNRKC